MTPRMWTKRMWTQNCWFSIHGLDYWGKREESGLNLLINSKRPLGITYKSRLLGAIVTTQATVTLLKLYHFSFKVEIKGQHFVETSLKLSVVTAGKLTSYTGEIPTRGKKKLLAWDISSCWLFVALEGRVTAFGQHFEWLRRQKGLCQLLDWVLDMLHYTCVSLSPQGFMSHSQRAGRKTINQPSISCRIMGVTVDKDLCQ